VGAPTLIQNRGGWPWTAFSVGVPVGQYFGWVAITVRGIGFNLPDCFIRVRVSPTAGIAKTIESDRETIPGDGSVDLICGFDFDYPFSFSTSVTWEIVSDTVLLGQCTVTSVRVLVGGGPPNGPR